MADEPEDKGEELDDGSISDMLGQHLEAPPKGQEPIIPHQKDDGSDAEDEDEEHEFMESPDMFDIPDMDDDDESEPDEDEKKKGTKSSEPDKKKTPKKPRFKTQAEAEKAHENAEAKMRKSNERAAAAERKSVEYEERLAKLEDKDREPAVDPLDEISAWFAEEMGKLDAPDPSDPESVKKFNASIGKLTAMQTQKVMKVERGRANTQEAQKADVHARVAERLKAENLDNYETEFYSLVKGVPKEAQSSIDAAIDFTICQMHEMFGKLKAEYTDEDVDRKGKQAYTPRGGRKGPKVPKTEPEDDPDDEGESLSDMINAGRPKYK